MASNPRYFQDMGVPARKGYPRTGHAGGGTLLVVTQEDRLSKYLTGYSLFSYYKYVYFCLSTGVEEYNDRNHTWYSNIYSVIQSERS